MVCEVYIWKTFIRIFFIASIVCNFVLANFPGRPLGAWMIHPRLGGSRVATFVRMHFRTLRLFFGFPSTANDTG
jgi:hypothetical protein